METWTEICAWGGAHPVATGFILLCGCLVVIHLFNWFAITHTDRQPEIVISQEEMDNPAVYKERIKREAQDCIAKIQTQVEKEKKAKYGRQRAAFISDPSLLSDIAALCAKQKTTRACISSWDCTRKEWKLRNRIVDCWDILEELGFDINGYADGDGSSIFIEPKKEIK